MAGISSVPDGVRGPGEPESCCSPFSFSSHADYELLMRIGGFTIEHIGHDWQIVHADGASVVLTCDDCDELRSFEFPSDERG